MWHHWIDFALTALCLKKFSSYFNAKISVADPGCLSRILIFTHPGIPPGSKDSNKREGWKKISCRNFLCSHKFHKIANNFSFQVLKKKILANFQRIIELFTQKIVTKLSKIWVWDPGSGKDLFRIPDPGVKKAPDPGSGSATLKRSFNFSRCTVEEGNFEHLINFKAFLKIWRIFFRPFFQVQRPNEKFC